MVAPLREVLVQAPTAAFGGAFNDPANGYLYPVDLDLARREHESFCDLLSQLGADVHHLNADSAYVDQIYTYDSAFVTAEGAILLRSGKPGRRGEEEVQAGWFSANGLPVLGRIAEPGMVDGGDVMWLPDGSLAAGRSHRTNQRGIDQLSDMVSVDVQTYDLPYDAGPSACLHLMSTISFVSDELAVVDEQRVPVGLHTRLTDEGVTLLPVPHHEIESLGVNVLAIQPNVVIVTAGNPQTVAMLRRHGVEVHEFEGREIAFNGTGGPTCLTRPVLRR